jgi:hypothetical protein
MPLTSLGSRSRISYTLQKTNTGLPPTVAGPASEGYVYDQPAGANQVYAAEITLAASATQDINLNSFTNLVGESVTGIGAYSLFLMPTGADVKITPSPSNGISWFFDSTGLTVPDGGELKWSQPIAATVSSGAGSLRLTNTSGSASVVVTIVVVVGQ